MFNAEEYKAKLALTEDISQAEKVPLPVVGENQNYVFISYSHRDYMQVYSELADMYEAGVRFWYDRGLTLGQDWDAMVTEKIQSPRCSGVIFYLSKNLFLSSAIKREISITTGRNELTGQVVSDSKAYFSVNLTEDTPSDILFSITPAEKQEKKLDSRWIKLMMDTFSDESTYLRYHAPLHSGELIAAIRDTFNVIEEDKSIVISETTYKGETKNGRRHGYGICSYADGTVYKGQWQDDKRHGEGILIRNGAVVYEGQWQDDRYHGYGICENGAEEHYEGEFVQGRFEGRGTLTYSNGKTWVGEFVKGKKYNGKGVEIYYNHHNHRVDRIYEGEMFAGSPSGQGSCTYANGNIYEGQWRRGLPNGQGKCTYAKGDVYDGEWKRGLPCEEGTCVYANGDVYEGQWYMDRCVEYLSRFPYHKANRHGYGVIRYFNGGCWTGIFNLNRPWTGKGYVHYLFLGEGAEWSEETADELDYYEGVYDGEMLEGKRNGQGTCDYGDGCRYEGQWQNDKRHGYGRYTNVKGIVASGRWENGELVQPD